MKVLLLFFIFLQPVALLQAQSARSSLHNKNIIKALKTAKYYYHRGLQYKNGDGVDIDYNKAYSNFERASALGDAQSTYAIAYMHYKGLGCTQDYQIAANLFALGAHTNRDNSMYFLGLCYRNGYGLDRNEDSARYWLQKAAALGYAQAKQELLMKVGENANDSATALIQKIKNAAIPKSTELNEFKAIIPHIPSKAIITGDYSGYLLSYDWSGKHIISNRTIKFSLWQPENVSGTSSELNGKWIEQGGAPVPLTASLKGDSLIFYHTKYSIKDHYSQKRAIAYNFKSANLSLVQNDDSVYLAGNIMMFSPDRREPAKPLFIALVRKQTISASMNDSLLVNNLRKIKKDIGDTAVSALKNVTVYPNPFTTSLTVEFSLASNSDVAVQLFNINGVLVYKKPKQLLQPGRYTITINPGRIASGTYILRLVSPSNGIDVKVLRK